MTVDAAGSETLTERAVAIEAHGVTRRYGDTLAVDGVDLRIEEGVIFGFVGPSGSGKTTTVRLLTGAEVPDEGHVRVLGVPPGDFSPAERQRMGYMPQQSVLYPHLSLRQNMEFMASLYGLPLRRQASLAQAMELVELQEHAGTLLRNASGGMQRRLALAAALLHEPELVFLDEPTAGIDPILRRKFWDHFVSLRDAGRTLFVTTQYVAESAYCDVVGIISDGRLVAVDTPEGLRRTAYGGELLHVEVSKAVSERLVDRLRALEPVVHVEVTSVDRRSLRVVVDEAGTALPVISRLLGKRGRNVETIEPFRPPFDDVFVHLVGQARADDEATAPELSDVEP